MRIIIYICCVYLCAGIGLANELIDAKVLKPYVFTDEPAVISLPSGEATISYTVKTITVNGWGPIASKTMAIIDHMVQISPLCEGIHIVSFHVTPPLEVRFLALQPPAQMKGNQVLKNLPLAGSKLYHNASFTILAMGDSVTYSGDYKSLLVMMLQRATGNMHITCLERSYPGRSVDGSVRCFAEDALATHPDLGIIMYGLNDQAAGCSVEGYLDQYHWLATQLAVTCHADTVFMTPTPDISTGETHGPYSEYVIRTFGFAARLTELANQLSIPLADTFHALWGQGGDTLDAAGKAQWPVHPVYFNQQFTTMLEADGHGDGIHPNVLGHLMIARAAFHAIMGIASAPLPLSFSASSFWTKQGVMSKVTVRNTSSQTRIGKLQLYPIPDGAVMTPWDGGYNLKSFQAKTFFVNWPQMHTPEDMLLYPNNQYITLYQPLFSVLDSAEDHSALYYVDAPFTYDAHFIRERMQVDGNTVTVTLQQGKKRTPVTVKIPDGAEVGRIPLLRKIREHGQTGWAMAEIAYVRYGAAHSGEATVDGNLQEWGGQHWTPVGEPVQARWTQGIIDGRTSPNECYLQWAFKAGRQGLYCAVKGTGQLAKDGFTLFFDNRAPELLGTPGRYYWASGNLAANGQVDISKGETSASAPGMTGAWIARDDGMTIELFIPYVLLEASSWPASGDIGLSIWWGHKNTSDNKTTNLFWSEDGQPWSTRWYGVVTLDDTETKILPYMVRVK